MPELYWLPRDPAWSERLNEAKAAGRDGWPTLVALAKTALDLTQTERLARVARKLFSDEPPAGLAAPVHRIAVIGSSTLDHLVPAIRVAGMRRNLWFDVWTGHYGQYLQELADSSSGLHAFAPQTVLLALDARHLVAGVSTDAMDAGIEIDRILDRMAMAWTMAQGMGAQVIQQTVLPVFPALVGANEHRLAWSPRNLVAGLNAALRPRAADANVDLLSLDRPIERDGIAAWHDPAMWHRTKQDVHPAAAPFYGDLVARLLAARMGRSSKCLVLDLDNTVWGGVIGDDGLSGIVLGQGHPVGEAHSAFQAYARDLSKRGIILAVCSKNDEANALEPFDSHPEMILRRGDIACFVANWQDKATNLRMIAQSLNIGLDSLVFADDNPFERNIVRRELPMVEVPELPEDPSHYVDTVADSGYFEGISFTVDDAARAAQYQANAQREQAKSAVTDINAYLGSLDMKMHWRPFDKVGLSRVAQLINKSNQFNLTTRRYSEGEVETLIDRPDVLTFQLRLVDTFGDNGMISVIICRKGEDDSAEIDTWLMSCRVLGRGVEGAALNLLADHARKAGVSRLVGRYLPTAKNGMVADHYEKLGFDRLSADGEEGSLWALDLGRYTDHPVHIATLEG